MSCYLVVPKLLFYTVRKTVHPESHQKTYQKKTLKFGDLEVFYYLCGI